MFKRAVYSRVSVPLTPATRTGVVRRVSDEVRAVPKDVKAKPGKRARTVVEDEWIDKCIRFGCVACWLDSQPSRPTAYHHIVVGGRRLGHLFGFGLCDPGHHQNGAALGLVSRHPFKARFELKYGNELDLLAMLKKRLGFFDGYEVRT